MPRGVVAAVASFLRPRWRQVAWAVALGGTGVGLLVAGRTALGFGQDVMVNVGSSLVMVALSLIVLDPIFEDMRRNAVEQHRTLNHEHLVGHIAAAREAVDIMETWTGLLEEAYRERFLAAARTALDRGVQFRILLLDPDSAAAEQRAEELHHTQVQILITENLRDLHRLRRGLDARTARLLEVRVYDASPSIQLYRWDDKAFISFFPVGVRAYDARQIEAFMASPLGEFVDGRFEELWTSATTRPMDEFMTLTLTVRLGDRDLSTSEAQFVRLDDNCFIDGSAFFNHLADHGARGLSLLTARPLAAGQWTGSTFDIVRVEAHDRPRRSDVVALFDAKYGPGHERSVILRLVPRR